MKPSAVCCGDVTSGAVNVVAPVTVGEAPNCSTGTVSIGTVGWVPVRVLSGCSCSESPRLASIGRSPPCPEVSTGAWLWRNMPRQRSAGAGAVTGMPML